MGRFVAKRGLRVVDADLRGRRPVPGVGHVGAVRRHGPAGGAPIGFVAIVAPYPGLDWVFGGVLTSICQS